jgi:hypothetical protein
MQSTKNGSVDRLRFEPDASHLQFGCVTGLANLHGRNLKTQVARKVSNEYILMKDIYGNSY